MYIPKFLKKDDVIGVVHRQRALLNRWILPDLRAQSLIYLKEAMKLLRRIM